MSKVRIYIKKEDISSKIIIDDKDIIHKVKDVLRCKNNDTIYIFNGLGKEYISKLEYFKKNILLFDVNLTRDEQKPLYKIILGFPILKEEKISFILQKATELGVSEFIPFVSSRSIQSFSDKKLKRWEKIIIEAARQSDRVWLPKLNGIVNFSEILNLRYSLKLFANRDGKKLDNLLDKGYTDIFIIVGPEGDFLKEEIELLLENNFLPINLSKNILRTETAAIFAIGILNYFLD